jgi:hypothetical protein
MRLRGTLRAGNLSEAYRRRLARALTDFAAELDKP